MLFVKSAAIGLALLAAAGSGRPAAAVTLVCSANDPRLELKLQADYAAGSDTRFVAIIGELTLKPTATGLARVSTDLERGDLVSHRFAAEAVVLLLRVGTGRLAHAGTVELTLGAHPALDDATRMPGYYKLGTRGDAGPVTTEGTVACARL